MKMHRGVSEGKDFQVARELLPQADSEQMQDVGCRRRLYDALRGCMNLLISAGPSPKTPGERKEETFLRLRQAQGRVYARKDWGSEAAEADYLDAIKEILHQTRAAGPIPEGPSPRRPEAVSELRWAMDKFGGREDWGSKEARAECLRHIKAALLWLRDEGAPTPQEADAHYEMRGSREPSWLGTATAYPLPFTHYTSAGVPFYDDDTFPPAIHEEAETLVRPGIIVP